MGRVHGTGYSRVNMPPDEKPRTAAVTSRSAVVATLLLAAAVILVAVVLRCSDEPDEGAARVYREFYPIFQGLYRSLESDFEAIADVVSRLQT